MTKINRVTRGGWRRLLLRGCCRFVLMFVGLLAGLALAEIILRSFLPLHIQPIDTLEALPGYEAIHRLKPNSRWDVCVPDGYIVTERTNSKGLRDYEYSVHKEKGVFRIAMVGDSVTEASQVEMELTFSKLLEARLNKINDVIGQFERIEVINFGVSGYGTDEELIRIRADVLDYDVDLVVVVFVNNDLNDVRVNRLFSIAENGELVSRSFSRTWRRKVCVSIFGRLHLFYYCRDALREYPRLYNAVVCVSERLLGESEGPSDQLRLELQGHEQFNQRYPHVIVFYVKKYLTDMAPSYQLVEALFGQMDQLLEEHGIPLVVVHSTDIIVANTPWDSKYMDLERYGLTVEDLDFDLPYSRMEKIWSRLGIPHMNLCEYLNDESDGGISIHLQKDWHPGREGQKYFAKHIERMLVDGGLVFVKDGVGGADQLNGATSGAPEN